MAPLKSKHKKQKQYQSLTVVASYFLFFGGWIEGEALREAKITKSEWESK